MRIRHRILDRRRIASFIRCDTPWIRWCPKRVQYGWFCEVTGLLHNANSMLARTSVVLAFVSLIVGAVACSSSSSSTFPDTTDGGDASSNADGDILATDGGGGSDAPTSCVPSLAAGFAPTFKVPSTSKGACTAAQIQGYADACLAQPLDGNKCAAFKQSSSACDSCIEADESAATYGPIIWHLNHSYLTLNVAGCIAIEENDTSASTCAGAYEAAVTCNEKSCENCFASQSPSFDKFTACQRAATTSTCASFAATESSMCAHVHDADAAASVCFPATGDTTAQFFLKLAPIFCGQ